MPIRGPSVLPPVSPLNLGRPESKLSAPPSDATPAQLKTLLEQNWASVSDGNQISRAEASWLQSVALHPNADASVRAAVAERGESLPLSSAASAAGFADLLKSLRPAAADPTTPPLPPGPVAPPVTPTPGGTNVLDLQTGGRATSVRPVAAKVPAGLSHVIVDPDDPAKGISLDKAKSLTVGETRFLQKPSDLFSGALTLNAAALLPDNPALAPLKAALDKDFVVRTTNNQYEVEPGKMGNRVVFFGDDHAEIKELLHHPDFKERGRFIKFMTHYSQTHWEGGPKAAFEHDRAVMSSTHAGALLPTTNERGETDIAWLDWPADYGRLEDDEYTANLGFFSLDNMEFTGPVPANFEEIKRSVYETMDTMAALQLIAVPFASQDPRDWNSDYKFNLLELTSVKELGQFTDLLGKPADDGNLKELKKYSQYCAEGVFNNTNYAALPVNQWSVDNGLLKQDALDGFKKMAKVFEEAGGLASGKAHKGWEALEQAGLITDRQLGTLRSTGMINVPFKISRDDVRPFTEWGPKGVPSDGAGEGMVAKPLSLAGLVGGMINVNFPREKIAGELSARLTEALQAAPSHDVAGQILGGAFGAMQGVAQKLEAEMQLAIDLPFDPRKPADHPAIIEAFGNMMAAQLQVGVFTDPEVVKTLHGAIRYDVMDGPSQAKVDKLLGAYARVAADFGQSRADLDKALRALDKKVESTDITYGPPIDRTGEMMVFVPPQYGALAYNGAGGASWPGLVPVADALHKSNQVGS